MKMTHKNEPIKTFKVTPTYTEFDKKLPRFEKLGEVGFFSKEKGKFHPDKRQRKHVIKLTETVKFDLKEGYDEWIRYEDTPENIDDLLQWIMHNPQVFQLHSEKPSLSSLNTHFVCRRGLLTRLVCTPYETYNGGKIAVIRFKDTFFLCELAEDDDGKKQDNPRKDDMKQVANTTPRQDDEKQVANTTPRKDDMKQVANTTPRQDDEKQVVYTKDEMSYWGYKFEQYITSAEKDGKPDLDKPIDNNEAFYSVVRSRLGDHSLVYGGEIDGIDDSIEGNNKYVELKTSKIIDSKQKKFDFQRYKLLKFWAQSHLIGISKIICGFKDDNGVVSQYKEFQTEEIPDNLQDLTNQWKWKPNVCMNFLNDILKFIKDSIETSDSKTVYLLEWRPRSDVTLKKTEDPQYNFLPDRFITWDGWKSEEST